LDRAKTFSGAQKDCLDGLLAHFLFLLWLKVSVALNVAEPDGKIPVVFFIVPPGIGLIAGTRVVA
jgi:hypothetical protein